MIGFFWCRRIRQLKHLNQLKKDKWENEIKRKIEKIFQLKLQGVASELTLQARAYRDPNNSNTFTLFGGKNIQRIYFREFWK